jgi:HSP20 family protein
MSQLDLWKKNWEPFRDWGVLPKAMDRWFEDMYTPAQRSRIEKSMVAPTVEVHETQQSYLMKFDLPGLQKDQIKIDLHDNSLSVSGERLEEKKEESTDKKKHLSEVYYGSFYRSFTFPETINAEKVEAKYENGVLSLNIPKKENLGKRQITIK